MNVNLDEIGSELNDLSTRVTTAEGSITTLQGEVTAVEGKTTDLESAVANKQDKLTAGQGIGIDQSTNTISSTTPITYLTRAEYDALETKDANTMYVITDEEGGGGGGNDDGSASMPSNKSIDLTLGASGTEYTAPANGWVSLIGQSSSVGTCRLKNLTSNISLSSGDSQSSFFINLYIPVLKNDVFLWERLGGSFNINTGATFKFVYAEGSK